jgi:hypothetical protein
VKVTYHAEGNGPHACFYSPCNWAGVYWLAGRDNWGHNESDFGYNLSGYTRCVFYARAEKVCTIEFQVGGLNSSYGDSSGKKEHIRLTTDWKQYEIDLADYDLSRILGLFCWVTNQNANPGGAIFYLDEIMFL